MTQLIPTTPLAAHARTQCTRCGNSIWVYPTHAGVQFALDDAPGPVVIDKSGKAFKTQDRHGYKEHTCTHSPSSSPRTDVVDDEFLWS
jgi:hypothetical protein